MLEMPSADWNISRTPSPTDSSESSSSNHFFENNSSSHNSIIISKNLLKNSKHYLNRFICSNCGEVFRYRKSWFKHIDKHERGFGCRLCAKVFPSSKELESHRRQHWVPLQCTHCQLMFTSKHKLTVHHCTPMASRAVTSSFGNMVTSAGAEYPCLYCGQLYLNSHKDHLMTCMAVPLSLQSLIRFERFYSSE